MRITFVIAAALFTLLPTPRAAAERTARIVFFRPPDDAPAKAIAHTPDGGNFEVELPRHNFSEPFTLPSGELNLRFLASVLPDDAEMPKEAPSVRVPESWKKVILLAFPDPTNKVFPASFKAINANPSEWATGQTMFINFTDSYVMGNYGSSMLRLKPNSKVIAKDVSDGKTSYKVRLNSATADQTKSGGVPLVRQVWRHYGNSRQLVYFYKSASGGVSYHTFPIHDL